MAVTHHFLIVYDHATQDLIKVNEFNNAKEAVAAYEAAEKDHKDEKRLEIVLVGADSIETIRVTHGQYFSDTPFSDILSTA